MLILSRKANQSIIIDGKIEVFVSKVDGDVVRIGVKAPREIAIHRKEVFETIERCNQEALRAAATPPSPSPHPAAAPTAADLIKGARSHLKKQAPPKGSPRAPTEAAGNPETVSTPAACG